MRPSACGAPQAEMPFFAANAAVARELACWVWEIGRRAEGTLG